MVRNKTYDATRSKLIAPNFLRDDLRDCLGTVETWLQEYARKDEKKLDENVIGDAKIETHRKLIPTVRSFIKHHRGGR